MNVREKKSRKRIYIKSVFSDHPLDSTAVTCYYLCAVDRDGSLDFTGVRKFFNLARSPLRRFAQKREVLMS